MFVKVGDLKQTRSRARDRLAFHTAFGAASNAWLPWTPEAPPPPRRCLRFAVTGPSGTKGIFAVAYEAQDDDRVSAEIAAAINVELRWFEATLPAKAPKSSRAVFYFKSDEAACTTRIWTLAALLRALSFDVVMLAVRSPGMVVFEETFKSRRSHVGWAARNRLPGPPHSR